jgi:hypothetical protein
MSLRPRSRWGWLGVAFLVVAVLRLLFGSAWFARGDSPATTPAPAAPAVLVVAVADEPDEWRDGVRAKPLRVGESLMFRFPEPRSPSWTMEGVKYPLRLVAWSRDGERLASVDMRPGRCCYRVDVDAVTFTETRLPT